MVEKARRATVEERRPDAAWEVFAREEADGPLRYVGAVQADDAESAHEEATRLFCWFSHEVWVCPASETTKFSADATDDADPAVPDSGGEGRTHEL